MDITTAPAEAFVSLGNGPRLIQPITGPVTYIIAGEAPGPSGREHVLPNGAALVIPNSGEIWVRSLTKDGVLVVHALADALSSGGSVPVVQIGSRANASISKITTNSTSANRAAKIYFRNGRKAMKDIRIVYANFYHGSSGQELTDVGTAAVRGSFELASGGGRLEPTWSGVAGYVSIPAGGIAVSDPIPGSSCEAFGDFFVHTLWTVAAGDGAPSASYYLNASRNEGFLQNATLATVENAFTGASSYGSPTGLNCVGPIGILGTPVDGSQTECILALGDSLAYGSAEPTADGDAYGNRGYISRGCGEEGYYIWNLARPGGTIASMLVGNSPVKLALFQDYATHLLYELGENSLSVGDVLADYESAVTAWKAAKAGIKVVGAKVLCKTTSTDSWATDGNQTVGTNDQYVATITPFKYRFNLRLTIDALISTGLLEGAIDALPYVKSLTAEDKWLTNGTPNYANADAIHPSVAGHVLAKQAIIDAINAGLFDV